MAAIKMPVPCSRVPNTSNNRLQSLHNNNRLTFTFRRYVLVMQTFPVFQLLIYLIYSIFFKTFTFSYRK